MGSGITDFGKQVWLDAMFGIGPLPTGYYTALCVAEPGPAMDGDILADLEPAGSDYHRQHIALGNTRWATSDDYVTTIIDLPFGLASTDWGQITHYALCDNPISGQVYCWGEFLNPVNVQSGYFVSVPAGGIVIALSALEAPIAI